MTPDTIFTEKEVLKILGTALTFLQTIPPLKAKALLYFIFYIGPTTRDLARWKRKDVRKRKAKGVFFVSKRLQRILNEYYASEPEVTSVFNLTEHQIRQFFYGISAHYGQKITVGMFREFRIKNKLT